MGTLRRRVRARAVESSLSIEGFHVSLQQARAIVVGNRDPAVDASAEQAVACYGRAMDHVAALADDPGFAWSERLLLDLHFEVCYFQPDVKPGRWRSGPVSITAPGNIVVYQAPEAEAVPGLMAEVVDWLQHGDLDAHAIVWAAMAHLHLVSIHPFQDGNGRLSRILQSLVLAREGLLAPELASIEEYLGEHTDAYYAALDEAHGPVYDPTRSARGWVEFCVTAHLEQANRRLGEVERAESRWNRCEELVRERRWPDRLVIALEQALAGALTNASYRTEADVSDQVARLDFRRLLDAGLIVQRGSGRATGYLASDVLRTTVEPSTPPVLYPEGGAVNGTSLAERLGDARIYRVTVDASPRSSL